MNPPVPIRQRFCIHGFDLILSISVPGLGTPLMQFLGELSAASISGSAVPLAGVIRPFDQRDVLKHLSPTAVRITPDDELLELFQEDERTWRIDDRWGICEMNLLKGQWRSWVMPTHLADPYEVAEQAVLWPMAQLLRPRGLWLIPAVAVARDGIGTLILSRFSIEPELDALLRAGYRLIGQSWTALREERGQVMMLHFPGPMQRASGSERIDLTREMCGSLCECARCDTLMLVAPGRRQRPRLRLIDGPDALPELRRAWPIPDLRPQHRPGQLMARLAQHCGIFDVQLSRNSSDMLRLLDQARMHRPPRVSVSIHAPEPRQRLVA